MNYNFSDGPVYGLGDLGFSLKKIVKSVVKVAAAPVKAVAEVVAPAASNIISATVGKIPLVGSTVAAVANTALNTTASLVGVKQAGAQTVQETVTVEQAAEGAQNPAVTAAGGGIADYFTEENIKKYGPWIAGGLFAVLILPKLMGGRQPIIIRANPRKRK